LREAGLLDAVKAAVAAAGRRVHDAWTGAPEWERGGVFLAVPARALGRNAVQVDQMFLDADAKRG